MKNQEYAKNTSAKVMRLASDHELRSLLLALITEHDDVKLQLNDALHQRDYLISQPKLALALRKKLNLALKAAYCDSPAYSAMSHSLFDRSFDFVKPDIEFIEGEISSLQRKIVELEYKISDITSLS